MKFSTLKEKCEYYRNLTNYKLTPNSYTIIMLDGHCFSKMIKNKFAKPFDDNFINAMNETAKYLVENIQGAKFAYVQSDEISILVTDFDTPETDSCFGYRICKMQSIFAAMAAAYFNRYMTIYNYYEGHNSAANYDPFAEGESTYTIQQIADNIENMPLYSFDCRCWNVPSYNDAYAWFLYRQHDCIRNSKQQAAQTYIPHKKLIGKNADEQIKMLKEEKGIDWHSYSDGEKNGRLIYKELSHMSKMINGKLIEFDRKIWKAHGSLPFDDNNTIKELIPKRNGDNNIKE